MESYHQFSAIYDRLNNQPHLQEIISQPLLDEMEVEMREEADSNRAEVITEINEMIIQMRNERYSNYLFDGSTNIGSYMLYMYL
jgi:23S rRNA maturation-related 3'-5' exoribonuclease YhaM|tara:strand:+ start:819 stop:1070 length:252 start_codon:yes stop_codon:yes gene_type:complete